MNTFDRYLLREWLQIIALVLAALLGLLMVQVMYTDLPPLLSAGASFSEIIVYLTIAIPGFLAILLPLMMLLSLLYVLGQMHRKHEFTALRASGISIGRITRPIWIIGVLCCALTWWLNSGIVPWSIEKSSDFKERMRLRAEAGMTSEDRAGAAFSVSFDNRNGHRLWFMNRYSRLTEQGYGVSLSFMDGQRREEKRIVASQAKRHESGKGWTFKNGRELSFDTSSGTVIGNLPFKEKFLPLLDEDPELMLLIDQDLKYLSFWQIKRLMQHLESIRSPKLPSYAFRYHGIIADTLAPLIVIAIAIPFAMSGVRVNPAVGISKSIGLFALYYVLAQLGSSLAAKLFISPMEAAWLPNLGMLGLACWFFYRLR